MLEVWGMQSTPSLPLLPGSLWPGVVASDRVLSMGQIKLNCVLMLNLIWNITFFLHWNCVLMLNWIVWNRTVFWHWNCVPMLNWIVWNRTVFWHWNCVLMLNWIVWNRTIYIYRNGFTINNLQWLTCHKTKPNLFHWGFHWSKHL